MQKLQEQQIDFKLDQGNPTLKRRNPRAVLLLRAPLPLACWVSVSMRGRLCIGFAIVVCQQVVGMTGGWHRWFKGVAGIGAVGGRRGFWECLSSAPYLGNHRPRTTEVLCSGALLTAARQQPGSGSGSIG